jgi:ABC-type dipeptide/oligopeptide/nickel transport system ATPase component
LEVATTAGDILVSGVSLVIESGQTMALVGESGSGKTLTALAVLGLLPPGVRQRGGVILVNGVDTAACTKAERRAMRGRDMSMIFQEPMTALDPVMRIDRQMLEARRRRFPARGREGAAWCLETLAGGGIDDPARVAHAFPHELSGGMRQRVLIAMGLAADPTLILADEPTTALDSINRRGMLARLGRAAEGGAGVLLITHDLRSARDWADQVVVMSEGRVVESGPSEEIMARPKHPYTKELLAAKGAR